MGAWEVDCRRMVCFVIKFEKISICTPPPPGREFVSRVEKRRFDGEKGFKTAKNSVRYRFLKYDNMYDNFGQKTIIFGLLYDNFSLKIWQHCYHCFRFRTLGCYPLTGAVESAATTLPEVIQEMLLTTTSERQGRAIDHDQSASMEKKKQEGYF